MRARTLVFGVCLALAGLAAGIAWPRGPVARAQSQPTDGSDGGPTAEHFEQVERMAHVVRRVFELCHRREAMIIVGGLAVADLGKNTDVDAAAQLEQMMETVRQLPESSEHRDALLRFTRLLVFDAHKKAGDPEAAAGALQNLVHEAATGEGGQ